MGFVTIAVVSNAPIDIIAPVDVSLLRKFGFAKMRCTPIDWDVAGDLEEDLEKSLVMWVLSPGGCGANIAVWLKMLGVEPVLIAPFARDSDGRQCRSSIAQHNICCIGYDYDGAQSRTFTLITDDKDRTFASVQGDVPTSSLPVMLEQIVNEAYFLIDGYFFEHEGALEAILTYLDNRPAEQRIIFCPNDTSVIVSHEGAMKRLLDHADILIMNVNEAEMLFPDVSDAGAIKQLGAQGKIGAITDGPYGATIFDGGKHCKVNAAQPPRLEVNTNGAGDAFAAGFLAGMILGLSLEWSGELGRYCAAEILTVTPARPDPFQATAALNKLGVEMTKSLA